jgi:hypothetical protein
MKQYEYTYDSEAELLADHVYYASRPEQYSIVSVIMSGNVYQLVIEQYTRTV